MLRRDRALCSRVRRDAKGPLRGYLSASIQRRLACLTVKMKVATLYRSIRNSGDCSTRRIVSATREGAWYFG